MHQVTFVTGMFFMVLTNVGALAAPGFADPRALVTQAYHPFEVEEQGAFDPYELFSSSLRSLYEQSEAETSSQLAEVLPAAIEPDLTAAPHVVVRVGDPEVTGGLAHLPAVVKTDDAETALTFTLVQEAGEWRIDDIESADAGHPWRLSVLLASDPLAN